MNPSSGLFAWTPAFAPSTNNVTIIVTDNGIPSLSATQSFKVTVVLPPRLTGLSVSAGQFTFTFSTAAGQDYQLEYKADLATSPWMPTGAVIAGTGGELVLTNDTTLASQRFYRLRLVP